MEAELINVTENVSLLEVDISCCCPDSINIPPTQIKQINALLVTIQITSLSAIFIFFRIFIIMLSSIVMHIPLLIFHFFQFNDQEKRKDVCNITKTYFVNNNIKFYQLFQIKLIQNNSQS